MADEVANEAERPKRGGYRPGAGRKRKKAPRSEYLSVRVPSLVKQWIEQICDKKEMTTSEYVYRLVKKDLRKRGIVV